MSFVSAVTGDDCTKKFMEVLQNDFRTLSLETKKKYPQIRESCDEAIEKLSLAANNPQASLYGVVNQILYPLVQGCESKDIKIIKFCLGTIQRLVAQQGIDAKGARHIVDCLTNLGQLGVLELKLLQTAALLMTTSDLVHGDTLARTLVLCLRMQTASETRDASTRHAAAATVRQLVALVFERAVLETQGDTKTNPADGRSHQPVNSKAPKELSPCAADAYLIFQDIVLLINGDQAHCLTGITEISKTFGLELLETVLTDFSSIFFKLKEFRFLLKEHVCALIIRLFSPNVKYRAALAAPHIPGAPAAGAQSPAPDRPHFAVSMRLLRLVSVIVHKYHGVLVTECEIFLSLTIKFLDPDKPLWQRALALEVLHKMTIRPELMTSFCECYDLKPHATNIFQDIVNALGAYVQSLFVASQVNTPAGIAGVPQQSGFYWKGVWLPLCVTFEPGTAKSTYLEMLDRTEAPTIADGYGISIAYACLLEVIRSIAITVEGPDYVRLYEGELDEGGEVNCNRVNDEEEGKEDHSVGVQGKVRSDHNSNNQQPAATTEQQDILNMHLMKSSWCGLVWGLSVLAEASVGELENILKGIQTLARISGKVHHTNGRDACIAALCRAALPAHYCLPALAALPCPWRRDSAPAPEPDYRHQVVAVGTPLPTAAGGAGQQQSFVMVTARHVAAMKALLWTAQRDGDTIQQAWLPVLTTLQHLVWILGLKPSTGGSLKASRGSTDANAVMSTSAVMADLPMLSGILSKVFECSSRLDDAALHHLVHALCKLSNEAMELAYSNREPSLFAVAKLLETGLANLHRVDVIWRPITNHLLEVCQHPHIRMREWGVEAITYLVQAALQHHHKHPQQVTEARQRLVLEPLAELSGVRHADVRSRQLECVARLLHSRPDQLGAAWPLVINIIAAIADHHSEQLIRSAFQCVQLVGADLLGAAGPRCLRRVLAAAAAFARQTQDLNISLTAVGLVWNISDYLFHNRDKLSTALADEPGVFPELPHHSHLPHLDKLWMCLYVRLSELCCEARAPVRRAASQTLFSCVGAHGGLLAPAAWTALLHHVLFPMLLKVQTLSNVASSEKVDTGDHILIHHSRNTAQKQWAETQVLTLSGVSRVFHSRYQLLLSIGDFPSAWNALLEFITDFSLRKNHEVSLASLKSFQEVLSAASRAADADGIPPSGAVSRQVWGAAWNTWAKVAQGATECGKEKEVSVNEVENSPEAYVPSQPFLAALLQIFPVIFQHVRTTFTTRDIAVLGACVSGVCGGAGRAGGVWGSLVVCGDAFATAPPHQLALHCLELLQKEALVRQELLAPTFTALLQLSSAVRSEEADARSKCLGAAARLYRSCAHEEVVAKAGVLGDLVKTLHEAVKESKKEAASEKNLLENRRKSASSEQNGAGDETSQIAALLLQVLATGIPLARAQPSQYSSFWEQLPEVFESFMFNVPARGGRELVLLVRAEVLGGGAGVPRATAASTLALLRRAALHTHTENGDNLKGREEFARTCFETLLQFSMLESIDGLTDTDEETGPLAVVALLDRFQEIVQKYNESAESAANSNNTQLNRPHPSEVSFVLKAIATLADSMKKAPPGKVDSVAWERLIGLYPHLVCCGSHGGADVREALLHYADLLRPPQT